MATVYLSIGSNLGRREDNCLKALKAMEEKGMTIKKRSLMYETEPWGVREQPYFINMAVEVETDLPPDKLLQVVKEIEKEMGRTETYKWGPRIIDIDILLYNDLIYERSDLKIPHPFMHERDFVLRPLSEIAPDKVHPVLNKTISELLQNLQRP
ncbi:MAG: 2-amino-4-hydroxy-6-hydroxymethyldihydropteridine diphosphokinase [Thermodesulfovibrionales bacterium]